MNFCSYTLIGDSSQWFENYLLLFWFSAYLFDMRRLKTPLNVFRDHVSAVIDVDFSPTGKEIVTGSYDKTVRIFEVDKVSLFIFWLKFSILQSSYKSDNDDIWCLNVFPGSLEGSLSYKTDAKINVSGLDLG